MTDALSLFYREDLLVSINRLLPSLSGLRIADIGCGHGFWLQNLALLAGSPQQLFGIDLDWLRVGSAHERAPGAHIAQSDTRRLPWQSSSFDLVTQFTVFTSVLARGARQEIANEMLRVLRPSGSILWYDFFAPNIFNKRTRAIRRAEIASLFPNCEIRLQKVTLAPPLARWSMRIFGHVSQTLNRVPMLRTHYLGLIHPRTGAPVG